MYNLIGQFCLFIGLSFSAIGLLGVLRFKNLYQRMHSISLIDSLGFFFLFCWFSYFVRAVNAFLKNITRISVGNVSFANRDTRISYEFFLQRKIIRKGALK